MRNWPPHSHTTECAQIEETYGSYKGFEIIIFPTCTKIEQKDKDSTQVFASSSMVIDDINLLPDILYGIIKNLSKFENAAKILSSIIILSVILKWFQTIGVELSAKVQRWAYIIDIIKLLELTLMRS